MTARARAGPRGSGARRSDVIEEFVRAAQSPAGGLFAAALLIARVEYPGLDPAPYLARIDAIGREAAGRVKATGTGCGDRCRRARLEALNALLFDDLGFRGNRDAYDDPRNSFLNDVLDRRTGIPIALSVLYMEVARRAGVALHGLNFPGHFLVRESGEGAGGDRGARQVIDPFNGGALLSERDCRRLLPDGLDDDDLVERALRTPATTREVLIRMLHNLKRVYVRMRSFPQARTVTDLVLALDPTAVLELRDRGLLAFHLNDVPAALRDLEQYLRSPWPGDLDEAGREEAARVWAHVKILRKRAAELN